MRAAVYVSGVDSKVLCFVSSFPRYDTASLPEPGTRHWGFFMETEAELPEIVGVNGTLVASQIGAQGFALVTLPSSPSLWPYGQRQGL